MEGRTPSQRSIPAPELVFPGRIRPEVEKNFTESELTSLVANITSLDQLCELLMPISEIPGASPQRDKNTGETFPYFGQECIKRIERLKNGGGDINNITRACGLRETVKKFIVQK